VSGGQVSVLLWGLSIALAYNLFLSADLKTARLI
jgi:hypothetical protein